MLKNIVTTVIVLLALAMCVFFFKGNMEMCKRLNDTLIIMLIINLQLEINYLYKKLL